MIIEAIGTAFDPGTEEGKANLEALENLLDTMLDLVVKFLTSDEIIDKFINAGIEIGKAFARGISEHINDAWKDFWGIDGDWTYYDSLKSRWDRYNSRQNGGTSSGGFGALQSGGYNNAITLNANFNVNGGLNEASARAYAKIMAQQINEELGQMV